MLARHLAGDRGVSRLGRIDEWVAPESREEEQGAEREDGGEAARVASAIAPRRQMRPASTRCSATSTAPLAAPIFVLCDTSM